MTGEEVMVEVRRLAGDQTISEWTEINRALRRYCRITNFQWLREVTDAPFQLVSGQADYSIPELGFRRIERIYVESPTTGAWEPVSESDQLAFYAEVAESTNADGSLVGGTPEHFFIHSANISFTPTPDEGMSLKITGTINTPTVERTKQLPGPEEYHDLVADMAAAFHLKRSNEPDKFNKGLRMEADAKRDMVQHAVRDSMQNRVNTLKVPKQKIAR